MGIRWQSITYVECFSRGTLLGATHPLAGELLSGAVESAVDGGGRSGSRGCHRRGRRGGSLRNCRLLASNGYWGGRSLGR